MLFHFSNKIWKRPYICHLPGNSTLSSRLPKEDLIKALSADKGLIVILEWNWSFNTYVMSFQSLKSNKQVMTHRLLKSSLSTSLFLWTQKDDLPCFWNVLCYEAEHWWFNSLLPFFKVSLRGTTDTSNISNPFIFMSSLLVDLNGNLWSCWQMKSTPVDSVSLGHVSRNVPQFQATVHN